MLNWRMNNMLVIYGLCRYEYWATYSEKEEIWRVSSLQDKYDSSHDLDDLLVIKDSEDKEVGLKKWQMLKKDENWNPAF